MSIRLPRGYHPAFLSIFRKVMATAGFSDPPSEGGEGKKFYELILCLADRIVGGIEEHMNTQENPPFVWVPAILDALGYKGEAYRDPIELAKAQQSELAEYRSGVRERERSEIAFGLSIDQEPKYGVNENGKLYNRQTGEAIPDDEPVFILRAQDKHALQTILLYSNKVASDKKTWDAVVARYDQFQRFWIDNPERMKEGDTGVAS